MRKSNYNMTTLSVKQSSATADAVASLCLKKFYSLPKTGKPGNKEWTVLSGIVLHDNVNNFSKVVALGAGTKCIGQAKLCPLGLTLNDSHAEVLARRGLLRYFYRELNRASMTSSMENLFHWQPEKCTFVLRSGVSFHFFSTQTPCGDACIASKTEKEDDVPCKRAKLVSNFVYTGAKLIGNENSDAMEQTLGDERTKPGRGDRTLSMSCSDKLAKWNLLGAQGALLDAILESPVYFQSINFCCQGDSTSLKRAIYDRFVNRTFKNRRFKAIKPSVCFCLEHEFKYQQSTERTQPSPNGLVWCDIDENLKPYEISVNGKRQGVTGKKLHTLQSALKISKYFFLQEYVHLICSKTELTKKLNMINGKHEDITYFKLKQQSDFYQKAWSEAKVQYFHRWTQKPEQLLYFCLNDTVLQKNKN